MIIKNGTVDNLVMKTKNKIFSLSAHFSYLVVNKIINIGNNTILDIQNTLSVTSIICNGTIQAD